MRRSTSDRYDAPFGTEWTDLSTDELIQRAFALGVADALGDAPPRELSRLYEAAPSTHDRNVVELAYDEGKTRARRTIAARGADSEGAWDDIVGASGRNSPVVRENRRATSHSSLRSGEESVRSVGGPPGAITRPGKLRPVRIDSRSRIRFPALLR